MQVFLIHGMGRSRASMARLARFLSRQHHSTSIFGYMVTRKPLPAIAQDFAGHIAANHTLDAPYAVVGHSLGNIITRLASPQLPAGFERFIMLAPPNRSPALARAGKKYAAFRLATGDAGRRLGDPEFYQDLPVPPVPSLIIAGNSTGKAPWLPHRGKPSDGVVAVDETRLPDVAHVAHRVVPSAHTFIMDNAPARNLIVHFLSEGVAPEDGTPPASPGS